MNSQQLTVAKVLKREIRVLILPVASTNLLGNGGHHILVEIQGTPYLIQDELRDLHEFMSFFPMSVIHKKVGPSKCTQIAESRAHSVY